MEGVKYCLIQKNNTYLVRKVNISTEFLDTLDKKIFDSSKELFLYMFNEYNDLSFLDIFKIFTVNDIDFNKGEFIKYFIANCSDIKDTEEEIYIKIKINKGSIYEILSILPKTLSLQKTVKGASLTLKIDKQYIPFYLAIFIKEFTIEDYYSTTLSLFGDSKVIPFIDLYNHNEEYYVVKNREKIVYVSTTKKLASYYINLIGSIRKDKSLYFVPNMELVCGFKNLINYLKIQNPDVNVNGLKNIVDFTGAFVLNSLNGIEGNSIIDNSTLNYIIKTKEEDYVLKNDIHEVFDFIIENKVHTPEIIEVNDMKRVISRREIFKSIFLTNIIENNSELCDLNGVSILNDDNLIKIYSNLVNILLLKRNSHPYISIIVGEDDYESDVLFFFDKESVDLFLDENKGSIKLLKSVPISLDTVKDKLIEKNIEILMNNNNFNSLDVAINLTSLYKDVNHDSPKVKYISDINCIIDVDSSLDNGIASCGIVLRDSNNRILGKISRELDAKTSVEAEIRGAMHAIKYALMEDFSEICLRYDYIGIFEYLITSPSTDIAREYQEFFRKIVNDNEIEIYFKKVKAHSSDEYNELADYLAGNLKVNESFER